MKRLLVFFAAVLVTAMSVSLAAGSAFAAGAVYDATPSPLPPNVASVGFEATSTSEFGDYVHLAGVNRGLTTVTVTMSDWALHSDYPTMPTTGWSHPITVNIYSGQNGVPGALLATTTKDVSIPWRPVADPTCPGGTAWRASDANCYNGIAFNATFDFSSQNVTLPDDVIVGVAYNTADYGAAPIGSPGPYNSLNVGAPNGQTASVGSDDNADNVFWNTSFADFYEDNGAAGVGTFREDTNWTPNGTAAIQINAARTVGTCIPTGFIRDGIDLTAAQIGGTVTGTLDATGCNIGVYYGPTESGSVSDADIFGANYYGVVVNGTPTSVNISASSIHDIGESPFNGSQHGVGVLYTTIDQAGTPTGLSATGTLRGSTITDYQKNGVVVSGDGAKATVKNNTVTGQGRIDWIAQNGIQISSGAMGIVTGNFVSRNFYTPKPVTACGLLFFHADGVKQSGNDFAGNEVNICNVGRGGGNVDA
jgi:hypothetical protein